jgi:ABC-type transporter Mla subunit MlaD
VETVAATAATLQDTLNTLPQRITETIMPHYDQLRGILQRLDYLSTETTNAHEAIRRQIDQIARDIQSKLDSLVVTVPTGETLFNPLNTQPIPPMPTTPLMPVTLVAHEDGKTL